MRTKHYFPLLLSQESTQKRKLGQLSKDILGDLTPFSIKSSIALQMFWGNWTLMGSPQHLLRCHEIECLCTDVDLCWYMSIFDVFSSEFYLLCFKVKLPSSIQFL